MSVFEEVRREIEESTEKFGEQNHEPPIWMLIIGEEFGEASQAALEAFAEGEKGNPFDREKWLKNYREELIQLANVVLKAVESFDRNEGEVLGIGV